MTIHKKGAISKTRNKETAKNGVTTTSSTTETTEVVSSTSVVEESRQVTESEARSSTTEVTSTSREIVMDSKGNVIKVIEASPQTVQQSTSAYKTGKSSQDFIAGEQTQLIKQAKTTHEIPREDAKSLSESHIVRGESSERIDQSVQMQTQSESRSTTQQSISSSTLIESSSTSEDHSGHRRSTVNIKNGDHAPVTQTSRATESTRASSETCETVTKDGQTTSNKTRIRETEERIDDNGKEVSTSSREVDSERTIAPSNVTVIKSIDGVDKDTRGTDAKSNIEISSRYYKPGQSAWDGTFVYEKPAAPRGKNVVDKTVSVSSKVHGDARDSETSVKVTQATSTAEEVIDQISSSSTTVIRDSKTTTDEGQLSATTRLRDTASEKVIADTMDFAGKEKHSKGPVRYSKLGDSAWDGRFVMEKTTTQPRRRNDSDITFRGDNVAETIERKDFREKSVDGTYEKESSETVRVVKGAADSTRFISEERHDVSRESSTRIDDTSSSKEEHPARVSSPSRRRPARPGDSAWNGKFVYEKSEQDDAKKRSPADVTVVRRTEKRHDSVDVEDVTEEQNVSESVSSSYIVEYAISNDKKNIEKVTSVSEVILEEDSTEDKTTRGPGSPERQSKRDAASRCYKPGQSAWDGTFVYEQPKTPDSRRKPEDKRTVKTVDIRDITGDDSINEADVTTTSYIVEHSSSQQSFSDVKDASLTSTIYETVVYEGRPVEMTIRFDKDKSQVSNIKERQPSPSPRLTTPEKTSKDRDLRSTKPGSSTWDGTFVLEKSQEKKRPPSRESTDGRPPEKSRPVDSKETSTTTSKKHVSDTTIDLRNITQDISSTSETVESVIVEQSKTHESYPDSSNLDLSTTSVETVIIRDGQPVTTQKTVTTIQEGSARKPSGYDVITDVKKSTVKGPEKKEPYTDDRSYRPTKLGSSTWDGSFVYEKSEEKKKISKDTHIGIDKHSPTKEKPAKVTDHKTVTILDTTSAADYSTSSTTVEQSFVTDSKTYDISKTLIEESTKDKVHAIDHKTPRQPIDEKPKPSPRQRPEDARKPGDEEPRKSPMDRTYRPSKPGASTWDGSFVYEKPQDSRRKPTGVEAIEKPKKSPDEKSEPTPISRKKPDERPEDAEKPRDKESQKSPTDRTYLPSKPGASTWDGSFVYEKPKEKPGDRKVPKDTPETTDKRSPIKEKPSDITDHRTSVTILDTSKDLTSAIDYSTSSTLVEQTFVTDSKTRDISKTFIEGSTKDKVYMIDHETSRQPIDERPKPSPRQRPEDAKKPGDEEPRKSPVDRTHRPSKPGASTWDGSFVYEKPQDSRKKPTGVEAIEEPRKSPDKKPESTPIPRKEPDETTPRRDVTESRYIEDVTDITREDITRTSEAVQRSSYVIDQSSSFTSVQDERVITDFTTDVRKDVRDVTESTKEFIDKEQVTSMVARDVVDNIRFDAVTGSVPLSPTRKPSPERPGYPRGIPGLREDDRSKPIPAAGKPSRPLQREKSPQRPTERDGPTKVRPKSPEKLRDYTSPTRKPQPAAGKPSQPAEKPEKPMRPEQDDKPQQGDEIPDEGPKPIPDIFSKIPLKEQCICELCTCGRHRCPHNLPQEQFEFPYEEPVHTVTSYRQDYDEKRVEKQMKYYHEDHLHTEGEFIGQRRIDYVATKGERAPVKKPQDHLKPEGEFVKRPKEEAPKIGERAPVKKPEASLKLEGDFDTATTTELVFTGTPGERPTPIRRNTYTKIEGDFVDETTTRSQYIDHRNIQRAEIIKRTDNLTVGEGEFTGTSHIKEDFQTHVIEREPQWRPKYPEDIDRFYSKTDIIDSTTTTQDQYRTFDQTDYKSTTIVRRADNLRPEGPFQALPHTKDDYVAPILPRRPELQKPKDNLRPEGPFEGRPKDDYTPTRGERADVKRPEDNLRPEGPFEGRPKDDYKPTRGERADVKRPEDNLRPEGPFEGRPKDDYSPKRAERPEVKRPEDNLRPEGLFEARPKDDYRPTKGERADVKRPQDNLKPEGPFEGRPKDDYIPTRGERADVKRPEDNLRPEGPFEGRPKDDYSPKRAERPEVKRPEDNLRPEGDFQRPEKAPIGPAERRSPIKHPDNLKPEGEFARPKYEEYHPAERPEIKKPSDNLSLEGDFERPEKRPIGPVERRTPFKYTDNLKPEGKFVGKPKEEAPKRGDRMDIKRPEDNLKPEGDFERPEKAPIGPAERRTPIKHPDNLRPEGEFEKRLKEKTPLKGERADVTRPKDNLRPEGEFERPQKSPIEPAERRTPIRHDDNLRPEGEFVGRPKDDFIPKRADRPIQKKPKDNLKPEGEFVGKPKDDYKLTKGERAEIVMHRDNLKMEGDIDIYRSRDDYVTTSKRERVDIIQREDNLKIEGEFVDIHRRDDYQVTRGERSEIIRHKDNLRPEGDFVRERPEKIPIGPAEKRSPIKHLDNLKLEGDFVQRPKEHAPTKGDRAIVRKPKDNLKSEGDFERPTKSPIGPAERRSPIKHPDNLHLEGEFVGRLKKDTPLKGDRADVKKPKDNLHLKGEFAKRIPKKVEPAERRSPIKHEDNLHPQGDFYIVPKDDFTPKRGDRSPVKKPQDNLRLEGEMEVSPKDDYKHVNGERVEVRRHEDHLRMEGQMDIHRSRDDYKKITKVEKVDVKKREDNLRMEGEFIDVRRKDDYVHVIGERVPIKKHLDNLRPEGDFDKRQKIVVGPGERRSPIKHPDNLKPEGSFERRITDKVGPGERRTPIRHTDNLKPEGDFIGRPCDDFTSKKTERVEVVKREDNLKMTGDFEGTTSHKSTYTVLRGERADIKSHEDNLKINTGTMETKTTTRDTYTPSKQERSPADKIVNRRKHMESSISLGDDTTVMTTTNRHNYNTYTKRTGKDIAAKMSQIESDTKKIVESQTLTDGTVITTIKRTSAHSDQRVANAQTVSQQQQVQRINDHRTTQPIEDSPSGLQPIDTRKTVSNQHHEQRMHLNEQHLRSQNVAQTRRTIEDRSITEGLNHRGQIVRGEDTSHYAIDAVHGEHHRQQHQHVERHHQEMSKRDYVNMQHMESRQKSSMRQQHEHHTVSSQARYNSSSPEFRQTINGQTIVEQSHVDSAKKISHHRKNVISSSSADVNNAVLYRNGGVTTSTEALHTISSTAADQRKSISNLAESGQYISNSSHSNDRRSLTSLHRSSKEANPWASSSYERPQRIVRHDNLTVGGKFYSQSEAKNYGNFSQSSQKVERVRRQTNASHINLGDGSVVNSSMYKREYVPRSRGPCPAALLEAKQAPFKHTRDTPKHKFYMPVVSN